MTDQKINVSIGASLDEFLNKFRNGFNFAGELVDEFKAGFVDSMRQVQESAAKTSNSMKDFESDTKKATSGAGGAFKNLEGILGPVIAGLSLHKLTGTVIEFSERAASLNNVAQIAGTTATAIDRLHQVAAPLAISSATVDQSMLGLARSIGQAERGSKTAIASFAAVGIKVDELKGMSLDQALGKIADKFKDTADGAGKTAAAQALMGRSGAEMIPLLNQGSKEMEAQGDAAEAMGAAMGGDAVEAGLKLDEALNKVKTISMGVKNTFAQALAPALTFIAELFTDGSGVAMDFGTVFKGVASIVIVASSIIKAAWEVIASIVRGVTTVIVSVVDAMSKAANFDFSGAKASLSLGKEMVTETFVDMNKNLDKLGEKTRTAIGGIWDATKKPAGAAQPETPKPQIEFNPTGGGNAGAVAAKKEAAEAQKAAKQKFEYDMELLRNELAETQKGSDQRLEIARQMTARVKEQYGEQSKEYERAKGEELRIAREVEAEKRAIQDRALGTARDHAATMIALEKGKASYLLATGQINAIQKVQIEQQAEEQLYQMQLSYLQKRLALMGLEPQEAARINQEIEQLQNNHLIKMQENDLQTFQTNKEQWDNYFQVINDSFASSIQGMIFQGTTLREAMGNILQNILGQLIQVGVKMVTNWATTQLAMTGATVTGAGIRTAAEVASAKTSSAATAGAAIKNIITKAAEVFANVYNAIAGIPYVGPFLAPVMAVAAGAVVIGMVGKVASAEGGWDRVPYDGAMTELHKEEMVLPAPLAEAVRSMAENGGQRGGGVTIHALDRRDVERYFGDNGDIIMGALSHHNENNPGGF